MIMLCYMCGMDAEGPELAVLFRLRLQPTVRLHVFAQSINQRRCRVVEVEKESPRPPERGLIAAAVPAGAGAAAWAYRSFGAEHRRDERWRVLA
jgi:hypothetical protein